MRRSNLLDICLSSSTHLKIIRFFCLCLSSLLFPFGKHICERCRRERAGSLSHLRVRSMPTHKKRTTRLVSHCPWFVRCNNQAGSAVMRIVNPENFARRSKPRSHHGMIFTTVLFRSQKTEKKPLWNFLVLSCSNSRLLKTS